MNEENKSGQTAEKQQLLSSLRNAERLYVFMSMCTKMPYVICDEETFDDEVLLYYTEEDAQREGKKLIEQRIPVQIAKLEKEQLLGFFASLYPMGINGLLIDQNMDSEARVELQELVKRPDTENLPEAKNLGRESTAAPDSLVFYAGDAQAGNNGADRRTPGIAGRDPGKLWQRKVYRSCPRTKRNAAFEAEKWRCLSADFYRYPGIS